MVHQSSASGTRVSLFQLAPSHLELHKMKDLAEHAQAYVTSYLPGAALAAHPHPVKLAAQQVCVHACVCA
jgi:hypothetical protein